MRVKSQRIRVAYQDVQEYNSVTMKTHLANNEAIVESGARMSRIVQVDHAVHALAIVRAIESSISLGTIEDCACELMHRMCEGRKFEERRA